MIGTASCSQKSRTLSVMPERAPRTNQTFSLVMGLSFSSGLKIVATILSTTRRAQADSLGAATLLNAGSSFTPNRGASSRFMANKCWTGLYFFPATGAINAHPSECQAAQACFLKSQRMSPFAPSPPNAGRAGARKPSSPAPRRPCGPASATPSECPPRFQCTASQTGAAGHGA